MKDILTIVLAIIPCFIISSAIHELGHLVVGLALGFRFYLFEVGPFAFKRNKNDKITFYLEKDMSLWGGIQATIPREENDSNYKKFGYILLGGPIASLILGVMSLPIGIFIDNIFISLIGAMTLGMGVACLIPARSGAFYTDGGRWLRMRKDSAARAVELAIWNLTQGAIVHGSHSKVSFDEIRTLVEDKDPRTQFIGHFYAYHFYKCKDDEMNMEKEKREIQILMGKVPKQMISMYRIK